MMIFFFFQENINYDLTVVYITYLYCLIGIVRGFTVYHMFLFRVLCIKFSTCVMRCRFYLNLVK